MVSAAMILAGLFPVPAAKHSGGESAAIWSQPSTLFRSGIRRGQLICETSSLADLDTSDFEAKRPVGSSVVSLTWNAASSKLAREKSGSSSEGVVVLLEESVSMGKTPLVPIRSTPPKESFWEDWWRFVDEGWCWDDAGWCSDDEGWWCDEKV